MNENNKRIAKNTVALYVRMLLMMAVSLYTSRIVLQVLGVEDFGIYNVIGGVVALFSFLNGAMSQSTQRFLTYEIGRRDVKRLRQVFSLSITLHLQIAVVGLILAETLGLWFLNTQMNFPAERMEAARWIYQFSVGAFLVSILGTPYNAAIIARERMSIYAYISIIDVALRLVIVFMLEWIMWDKLKLYAILNFAVSILMLGVTWLYCRTKFTECRFFFYWNLHLYKQLSSFAGWNLFGSLAWLLKAQGLNLVLNIFFGPIVNAAYGIASQVNAAVNKFVQNFTTAMNPQIVKSYAAGEQQYMTQLVCRGAKFSYFLLLLFAVPLLIEMPAILSIWLGTVPDHSITFTRLIIVNSMLESFTYVMGTSILATGHIRGYQVLVGCTILLNLPVAYLLLRLGAPPASVLWVSVTISCITLLQRLYFMHRHLSISARQFTREVFLPSGIVSIFSFSAAYFISACRHDGTFGLFISLITIGITTSIFIFVTGMTHTEREYILRIIRNHILTFRKK